MIKDILKYVLSRLLFIFALLFLAYLFSKTNKLSLLMNVYATYDYNIVDYTNGDLKLHRYTYENGVYTWGNIIDNYISFDLDIDNVHGSAVSVQFQQPPAGKHVLGVRNNLRGGHLYKTNVFYCYGKGQSLTIRGFHINRYISII